MFKRNIFKEKGFNFAEITNEEYQILDNMEFDKFIITHEQISCVKNTLQISDQDDIEYVRAFRNSIVRHYSDMLSDRRLLDNYDVYDKTSTSLSAITCALDTIIEK